MSRLELIFFCGHHFYPEIIQRLQSYGAVTEIVTGPTGFASPDCLSMQIEPPAIPDRKEEAMLTSAKPKMLNVDTSSLGSKENAT